ncbi:MULTISPECIES: hypothetical protein [Actinomadura]|uniref:Uncharacterized protein n=1 Tax=Actinomadura litoris TaxID=2678616 RepID=A0A7K1LAY4_9ACTN|nr:MULTISPECIES: hypothetical protein [Actinomadura]MBT2213166.1 hypothetical protein [Actinomadura sp. NEAU-AAG7]MUN41582.1 hypothetical protein [Actinomadura litoris]
MLYKGVAPIAAVGIVSLVEATLIWTGVSAGDWTIATVCLLAGVLAFGVTGRIFWVVRRAERNR